MTIYLDTTYNIYVANIYSITFLFGSVDWFVRLYENHSVFVAKQNLGFLVKLKMSIV